MVHTLTCNSQGKERNDLSQVSSLRSKYVLRLESDRISFSFSFSAPKNAFFLFFGLLFFGRKRCTYFGCILFFGINMAVKITENSECFNSADARSARSTVNFSQHVQPQSALGTNVV